MQIQQMILCFHAVDIMIKLIYRGQYIKHISKEEKDAMVIFIWTFQLTFLKAERMNIVTSWDVGLCSVNIKILYYGTNINVC